MDTDNSPDPVTGLGRDGFDVLYSNMLVVSAHLDQKISRYASLKVGNTDNKNKYYDASTGKEAFKVSRI